MKKLLLLVILLPLSAWTQNDTINVRDSLGRKQGHWIFLGGDFPNSGVAASDILEEGYFENDQRYGLWFRYGAGNKIKAIMLFHIDRNTHASVRDQFYNYSYHSNGNLKRKPVIGACRTMCDYFQYDESGSIQEIELFDSVCNTTYKLQRIQPGEMDAVSILQIDERFEERAEEGVQPKSDLNFSQSGEYCADYEHRVFQIGTFEDGFFRTGREYLFDDMMRAQRVRYFENGVHIKTVVDPKRIP